MTQHQAPEVTSELAGCPFCGTGCSDDHNAVQVQPYVSHGEWSIICECCQAESGIYMSKAAAITAWNTRATQPLSLTVDEGLVIARLRELLAKATPLPWVRANLANITTKFTQVAPNITSQHTAYRSTDDVLCTEAVNALPALLDRLQSRSLPVDIDRSGLAQEVDDISYAGVGP